MPGTYTSLYQYVENRYRPPYVVVLRSVAVRSSVPRSADRVGISHD